MRITSTTIFSILIVGLMLLSACSSGVDEASSAKVMDEQAKDSAAAKDAGSSAETVPAAVEKEAPKAAASDTLTPDDLKNLFKKANLEYKAEYEVTAVSEGETINSKMTLAVKNGNTKTETEMVHKGQMVKGLAITKGDIYYACSEMEGKMKCYEFDKSQMNQDSTSASKDNFEENMDDFTITSAKSRTIAGKKGTCFNIVPKEDPAVNLVFCYSKEGILLYMGGSDDEGGKSVMEAKSVSTSVKDSEFNLPAIPEKMEIPSY